MTLANTRLRWHATKRVGSGNRNYTRLCFHRRAVASAAPRHTPTRQYLRYANATERTFSATATFTASAPSGHHNLTYGRVSQTFCDGLP